MIGQCHSKALVALYGRVWARGISTHYVEECECGMSAINMRENRDRVCQHSLGRRMGTGDISTYLAK